MTNAELLAKIKAEIERLKAKYRKDMYKSNHEGLASGYKIEAYNELLSFLSTLEPEKPMVQEGLEREIERCLWKLSDDPSNEELRMFARNFYDLGCRHTAEKYDEIEYNRQRAEESEKPMNPEEEISRYLREECSNDDEPSISDTARHFAQWGAEWQKEQMMKEAVKADVMLTLHDKIGDISLHTGYLPKELGIKCDDKVRIIIVKE